MVSRQVFMYVGHDLVAEHTTAGDASSDVVVGRVWVQDPGTGETVGQVNLHSNTDSVSGVSEWSQAQVDAVFYALVADLAGAPQDLIDTEQGTVVGHVTQSLFGRRQWSGVASPVLFAEQYENHESGWVYNRFRFYDPAGGVYGSQDPLGVGPNVGTPQGYVHNPLTWVDTLGLQGCEEASKIVKVNGKNPQNYRYAGSTYTFEAGSDLAKKYPDGVKFTEEGFPDFTPYTHEATIMKDGKSVTKTADVQIEPGTSRDMDFRNADKELGITEAYRKEHKLTWHHHEDTGRMILVPTDLHQKVNHTGGFAIWGAGKKG